MATSEDSRFESLLARGISREKAARIMSAETQAEPEVYEEWSDEDLFGYAAHLEVPGHEGMTRAEVIVALRER